MQEENKEDETNKQSWIVELLHLFFDFHLNEALSRLFFWQNLVIIELPLFAF
jgi:hypothetical protein